MCDPNHAEGKIPKRHIESEPVRQFLRLLAHQIVTRLKKEQSAAKNPKTPSTGH